MQSIRHLAVLIALLGLTLAASAGSTLSLRLVEARNMRGTSAMDKELEDVYKVLKESLPFNSYTVIDTQQTSLPASSTLDMARDYHVTCTGEQRSLQIIVEHRGRQVLTTRVELQDGKPLIIGGFSFEGGKLILIVVSR